MRTDLSFHLQEYQGAQCYLIEDELNSRFFRVGLPEYHLISLLDGSTSIAVAVSKTAAQMGDQAVSEQEAITIAKWLIDTGLATTDASRSAGRLLETFEKSAQKKQLAKLNPISPKFSLFNPDRLLSLLSGLVGWIFGFPAFLVWLGFVLTACYHVAVNWNQVTNSHLMVFSPDNWVALGIVWIVLKLAHETAHGLACKRFGGDVRQCGMVLIVMIPLPFVDVTSSWRFASKWQRIFVAAAGMYVEIFIAAIATLVWANTEVGVVHQQAFNVMLAGSFTTVFFNANPLMRFDGYYMLSDWLELPNLGSHGQQWMKWVGRRYYLGIDAKQPSWPEGRQFIVAVYAILALGWKVLVCVGLAVAAESLFFGAGVVLAALAIGIWVLLPIGKLLKMVFIGDPTQPKPSRIRFCGLTLLVATVVSAAYCYVPWYARVKAPAIVDFQESHEIRTPVGGFLTQLLVASGQPVRQGQLLARLENQHLDADIEKIKIELAANDLRIRKFRQQEELAACDVESKNRAALQKQLNERLQQQENLDIRATADGIVVADDLESARGIYLAPGHKLCTIQTDHRKEVRVMVSQYDLALFKNRIGETVDVHVWGDSQWHLPARLNQLNPRGQVTLPHPAFSATAGGPLPVTYRAAKLDDNDQDQQQSVELVDPHFLARVELSPHDSTRLRSGQQAVVSFRANRGSIGDVLSEKCVAWIRNLRQYARNINR